MCSASKMVSATRDRAPSREKAALSVSPRPQALSSSSSLHSSLGTDWLTSGRHPPAATASISPKGAGGYSGGRSPKCSAETSSQRSNSSGWLQTFRSCMTTFMRLSAFFSLKLPPPSPWPRISLRLILLRTLLYMSDCLLVRWHGTITSVFFAISDTTSSLMRRNMNGEMIWWRRRSWCSLSSAEPCAAPSMPPENHSWNCS
mmetsp:Transcript_452/g.1712  ORF Transcript_452/g.1712 Transcript_452/m.1712 type:complete len:202 (-) Transcript_452:886-1491(-)